MQNFDQSLKYVLLDEGGNDDDPRDHGGRTSRGITQRNYDAWCRLNSKPVGDVWRATDSDIESVYRDQYWNPYCDQLPSGLDYLFFDISVNAGRTQAVRTFQKALEVNVDGMMGQVTRDAINNADPEQLIQEVSDRRRAFYHSLSQFDIYGKGWINRTNHAESGALAILRGHPSSKIPAPSSKATKPKTTTVSPETGGVTTGGVGGITVILNQLQSLIEPYKDVIKYAMYISLGLAVVGMGYTVYAYWKKSKVEQAQ